MKPFTLKAGFTLIELLVAVAIFSIVLLITSGIFTRYVFTQRRDIGEQRLQEDVRLAFELFNREARTAFGDTFTAGSEGDSVTFRNQNRQCVWYGVFAADAPTQEQTPRLRLARVEAENVDLTEDCSNLDLYAAGDLEPITAPVTHISSLSFEIRPAVVDGEQLVSQGFITVVSSVNAAAKPGESMHVQSTVTSRQTRPYNTSP